MDFKSALERLKETHPGLEIWWDSSPLIYEKWREEFLSRLEGKTRAKMEEYTRRLYDPADPSSTLFDGVTTNPPLSRDVLRAYPEEWSNWTKNLLSLHPNLTIKELAWRLYSEIVKRGAERFLPKFNASGYRKGYISGQVDPRALRDAKEMVKEAISLNQMSPNIMIKMPGTKEGIYGITLLTALGIPTNSTLVFSVPQILRVAEAVKLGLKLARENGVDLSKWRSVITMMLGRFEEAKEFQRQAEERGIKLDDTLKRWAGIAVFRKAYKLLKERGYESKLLAASMRTGPIIGGKERVWHLEKLAGGDVVLTIFPNVIETFLLHYEEEALSPQITEDVPEEVLETLLKIPYFVQAYEEDGLSPEEFVEYPPTVETAVSFSKAMDELEEYVRGQS